MKREQIKMDQERSLLTNLITNTKFCNTVIPLMESKDLVASYSKVVYGWVKTYYEEFHRAPNQYIKNIYLNNKLSLADDEVTSDNISVLLKSLSEQQVKEKEDEANGIKKRTNTNFEIKQAIAHINIQRAKSLKDRINDAIEANDFEKVKEYISKFNSCGISETKELYSRIGSLEVKAPDWLINGLFEIDSTTILFGDPGTGKSFIALDIGASIACNIDFHTFKTIKTGPVVYICGEGRNTIARRCQAWAVHNDLDLAQFPFYILNTPIQLLDAKSLIPLQNVLKQINDKDGQPVLLIIDTWNRLEGGEENSNSDTAKAIAALDKLCKPYQCSRLIVHHVGVSDKGRARGASALNGAVDNAFKVDRDGQGEIQFTSTKCKDGEPPKPMNFMLEDIDLGITDEKGQEIYSAILTEDKDYIRPSKGPQGKNQKLFMDKLEAMGGDKKSIAIKEFRKSLIDDGMGPSTYAQTLKTLIEHGEIYLKGNMISKYRVVGLIEG
jgi:hypothetical protein